ETNHHGSDSAGRSRTLQFTTNAAQTKNECPLHRLPPPNSDVLDQGTHPSVPTRNRPLLRQQASHNGAPLGAENRSAAPEERRSQQAYPHPNRLNPLGLLKASTGPFF